MSRFCIGDWVNFHSLDCSEILTGFIVADNEGQNVVKVCVPKTNRTYTVLRRDMTRCSAGLRLGDTQALIDLSLQTRDEKWFHELVRWKPKIPANLHIKFLWIFIPLTSVLVLLA